MNGAPMWYTPDKPRLRYKVDWRRIGSIFAPYWRRLVVVVACILVTQVLGLIPAWLTAAIIDRAIPRHDYGLVIAFVAIMTASALLSMLVGVLQGFLNASTGESIMRDMRTQLISHLHKMPLAFFTDTRTGEIMNRVSGDVDSVDGVVTGTATSIVTNTLMMVSTAAFMLMWNWRLALVAFLVVPAMIVPLGPIGRRMYEARKTTRVQRDSISSAVQETLSVSGITLIKSFAREEYERARIYNAGTQLMHLEIRLAMVGRWFLAAAGALVNIGPAVVWLLAGWYATRGELDVGVIVAFVTYIGSRLYGPAAALAGVHVQIVGALAVFERIFQYLDMETEACLPVSDVVPAIARGEVEFDRVTFGYDSDREILHDLSFVVEPGKVVALVGSSGAGKSTIAQLIPRFYAPTSGRVLIDGHDARKLPLESLRRNIGIVMQDTYLFHDTIAANLRYAKPEASDAELAGACTAANLNDLIVRLPNGYETIVGERGHKLSGGERQRLAIARVLLKDPRILILDEATSALDSRSEEAIQRALEEVMRGRTSLVIAHRLSTIVSADVIVVIENGRIVETGSHAELLTREGAYASLYRTQFGRTAGVTA